MENYRPMNISTKKIIIVDHGLFTCIAQDMAKYWGEVMYWNPRSEPYSHSPQNYIGNGLPGVRRIDSLFQMIDKADCIFFPDVYEGDLQHFLRQKGYLVCGAGRSEKLELDKAYFKQIIEKVGLPQAFTYRADGLDDVWNFLKAKTPGGWYMKNAEAHRGDWETAKFLNKYQLEILLNQKRQLLGPSRANEIEILIEKKIDSLCETGCDGMMFDGDLVPYSMVGYEVKSEGYIGKVFQNLPKILQKINDKLEPVFKRIGGYYGIYSNEIRVTNSGKAYLIDPTCRCPFPPIGSELEIYKEKFAEGIWALSNKERPDLSGTKNQFSAEIVLKSDSYEDNDLHINAPKDILENNLKLCNSIKRNGQYYCIPNENDGAFGTMVGVGTTIKQAIDNALSATKEIEVDGLSWRHDVFDEAQEAIKNGQKFGIDFY